MNETRRKPTTGRLSLALMTCTLVPGLVQNITLSQRDAGSFPLLSAVYLSLTRKWIYFIRSYKCESLYYRLHYALVFSFITLYLNQCHSFPLFIEQYLSGHIYCKRASYFYRDSERLLVLTSSFTFRRSSSLAFFSSFRFILSGSFSDFSLSFFSQ